MEKRYENSCDDRFGRGKRCGEFEDQAYPTGKYYEQARNLLTGEVNAALEVMVEEGIFDIVVIDGHGAGGICYETLHPAGKLCHGQPLAFNVFQEEFLETFDATIMIGQHAMAGVERGNLNHTQCSTSIEYYKLNGKYIGELAQWALCAGAYGVPLIYVSGDEATASEARDLIPDIVTVTVKKGLSRTSAISYSISESHQRIRDGMKQALNRNRNTPILPLKWQGPFTLEKRYFHSGNVDSYASNPYAKIIDPLTVQLISNNILDIIYA